MESLLKAGSDLHDYDLTIRPFTEARMAWRGLVQGNPLASLYHSEKWIELLRRAYGLRIVLARVDSPQGEGAACVLAHSRNPLRRRLTALSFSDACPALGGLRARDALLSGLAALQCELGAIELRGVAAPEPWIQLDHFALWTLDLSKHASVLERSLSTNFRRNVGRAVHHGVNLERGQGNDLIERFYRLNVESRHRMGLPSPPLRFFRATAKLFSGEFDIWIASRARRDLAAVLLLRHGARLYYKWSARTAGESYGAGHLLLWNIISESASRFEYFDLGRADRRNHGLSRFKREVGAVPAPLPCSFLPRAPHPVSAEHLSGLSLLASSAWKRLPRPIARALGGAVYGLLS